MAGAKVVVEFLTEAVGGRVTPVALVQAYRPHLRVGDGGYLGVSFCGDESIGPVRPGVPVTAQVAFLHNPAANYAALAVGHQFQVLEGSRIVAVGVVTALLA
jgi:translation elongation factor EF-Tu-like GTPase